MNHSRLFEELLLELQTLINSDDEYDLIKSSRVLRQLLLDGDALLHIVNRELRAIPDFRVLGPQDTPGDLGSGDLGSQVIWGQVLFLASVREVIWGQVLFLASVRVNARNKT